MGALEFQWDLKEPGHSLLAALWKIHSTKTSGILSIEWEKFKKQILFKAGLPVVVKSNSPKEAFAAFVVHQKLVDAKVLQDQMAKKEKAGDKGMLQDWLLKNNLIRPEMMPTLMQAHFRERLFNLLSLTVGKLQFNPVSETYAFGAEIQNLSEPFPKVLWEALEPVYSEKLSQVKLQTYFAKIPRVLHPFPLPLRPQDLRVWNQIESAAKYVKDLEPLALRLLAMALEMEVVSFEYPAKDLNIVRADLAAEMRALESKFQKARAHEILGLEPEASIEDYQKAYHELTRRYHPDRLPPEASKEVRKLSETLFSRINAAFSTLTDPEKREEYLAEIQLEKSGGMQALQARLEAEFMIPQAQQALKRRRFQMAYDSYAKIVSVLKDDGEVIADFAYSELMLLIEAKGDWMAKAKGFRKDFDKAIQIRSNYGAAYYYRGLLSKHENHMDAALTDFESAVRLDPKLTEAASELRLLQNKSAGSQKKR